MDNEERFDKIVAHLKTLTLNDFRMRARLKALEAMVEHTLIPSDKVDAWHARLNKETKILLQQELERLEEHNPELAAMIDQRDISELDDLD